MHFPKFYTPLPSHNALSGQNLLDTDLAVVEEFFRKLTSRDDIAIILINQTVRWALYTCSVLLIPFHVSHLLCHPPFPQIANDIRHLIRDYKKMIPTLLEIPSKDHAYDPEQDSIMQRVNMILGFQG